MLPASPTYPHLQPPEQTGHGILVHVCKRLQQERGEQISSLVLLGECAAVAAVKSGAARVAGKCAARVAGSAADGVSLHLSLPLSGLCHPSPYSPPLSRQLASSCNSGYS